MTTEMTDDVTSQLTGDVDRAFTRLVNVSDDEVSQILLETLLTIYEAARRHETYALISDDNVPLSARRRRVVVGSALLDDPLIANDTLINGINHVSAVSALYARTRRTGRRSIEVRIAGVSTVVPALLAYVDNLARFSHYCVDRTWGAYDQRRFTDVTDVLRQKRQMLFTALAPARTVGRSLRASVYGQRTDRYVHACNAQLDTYVSTG